MRVVCCFFLLLAVVFASVNATVIEDAEVTDILGLTSSELDVASRLLAEGYDFADDKRALRTTAETDELDDANDEERATRFRIRERIKKGAKRVWNWRKYLLERTMKKLYNRGETPKTMYTYAEGRPTMRARRKATQLAKKYEDWYVKNGHAPAAAPAVA